MRSKHYLALAIVGGGLVALVGEGCGSSSTPVGSSSSGSGASTATGTPTSSSGTPTASSSGTQATGSSSSGAGTGGTGGTGGSGTGGGSPVCTGNTVGAAVPITVGGTAVDASIPSVITSPCYYSFTGVAGHRFVIQALAQGLFPAASDHDPNDPTVMDTVVSVYLPDMTTLWARNDDAWPRLGTDSTLYTELPMDGTYYVQVEDCNALAAVIPTVSCAPKANITDLNFSIFVGDLTANASKGAEVTGSTTAATPVTYTVPSGNKAGEYGTVILDGDDATTSDVQKFTLVPPTDTETNASARNRAFFWVQSIGTADGTGTLDNVTVSLTDTNGNILGQADQQYYANGDNPTNDSLQFSVPLDDQFGNKLGSTYTLNVGVSSQVASITPTKAFYIVEHYEGGFQYGQPEAEGPTGSGKNDTAATAETLVTPTGDTGAYFIDGNLSSTTDVDWYTMTLPASVSAAYFQCSAARDGSGLQGFTAELFQDATGTKSLLTLGPETIPSTTDLNNNAANSGKGTPLTAGTTTLTLKISATGQSTTNKGTYYWCAVTVQ